MDGKLRRLIEEFGVQPAEAGAACQTTRKGIQYRPGHGIRREHRGSRRPDPKKPVAAAQPGDWVTLEGKVVSLSTPASPAIAQSGIIADESGGIRFVVWAKSNAPKMEEGRWYRLESAVVDEYKGVPNLKLPLRNDD